jgi:hypothetical protein
MEGSRVSSRNQVANLCVINDLVSGENFEIPRSVFDALRDMLKNQDSGSVTVHFKTGGVAGVESLRKKSYQG